MTAVLFAWLVSDFGWRDALLIVGLGQLVLCMPLAISLRDRPDDMGLPMDGVEEGRPAPGGIRLREMGGSDNYSTSQALRSSMFWKMALAFALSNFATTGVIVHQIPFLTDNVGISSGAAAASMTVMTGISIAGRLGFGSAADRYPKPVVISGALACTAAGLLLFATVNHAWQLVYVLPLFGLGFGGAVPLRSAIQAEYFGLKAFGAIQGMVLTVTTVGAVAGPILAGWIYDTSGDYRPAFLLLALGPLAALPLILSTKPKEGVKLPQSA